MSLNNPKHRRAAALFVAAATFGGAGLGMTAAMAAETVAVPAITGVSPLVVPADTADVTVTIKGKNLTTALVKAVALGADLACANLVPTFGTGTNAGKLMTVTTPEGGCAATETGTETIKLKNPADVTAVDQASCPAEEEPEEEPTEEPSESPSEEPSESPSESPSAEPTEEPSGAAAEGEEPTESPSASPTETPTETPSETPSEEPTEEPAEEEEPADPVVCTAGTVVGTPFTGTKSVKFVTAIEVDDVFLENGAGVDEDLRLTKIASTGGQLVRIVAEDSQEFDAKPVVTVTGNAKLKLGVTKVGTDKSYVVVKTPKGLTAGALKVDITNKGVKTANVDTGLTVAALPAVTGVSPNFGAYATADIAGATIVIKGSGWNATPTSANTKVKVCGVVAEFVTGGKAKNDAKQLTVKAPAVPESVETAEAVCPVTVTLVANNVDGATSQLSGGSVFTYIAH